MQLITADGCKNGSDGRGDHPISRRLHRSREQPRLREFRERLRDIVAAPALIPPHISLLYTLDRVSQGHRSDLDAEMLTAIAARCAEAIEDTDFTLARP